VTQTGAKQHQLLYNCEAMHKYLVSLALFLLFMLVSGCARESRQVDSAGILIKLAPIPFPPIIGESRLVIQIADNMGNPIDDAQMAIRGSMSHAGMIPVLAELEGGGKDGVYDVPFDWTMAGDWIVTVDVQLPDGTMAEEHFDIAVQFEDEERCGNPGQE
jgi:hypothetical protein